MSMHCGRAISQSLKQSCLFLLLGFVTLSTNAETLRVEPMNGQKVFVQAMQYLVVGERDAVLVDAGYEDEADSLMSEVGSKLGCRRSLSAIVITHAHADHIGGLRRIQEIVGTKLWTGKCPVGSRLRSSKPAVVIWADERELVWWAGSDRDLKPVDTLGAVGLMFRSVPLEPIDIAGVNWINRPGTLGELSGSKGGVADLINLVHTPGHTKGSITLVADKHAFVGDMIRAAGLPGLGWLLSPSARRHFTMQSQARNANSLACLLHRFPDLESFHTGHKGRVSRKAVDDYMAREEIDPADCVATP